MGKGYGSTTIPVHAGIVHDLAQLCKKFREKNSVRLTDFKDCFREMSFHEIWRGRQSSAELIEFSEKLLIIAAGYMTSERQSEIAGITETIVHTMEERIFGIYCCFAFYYLQPRDFVTLIRITPEDMADVTEFFTNTIVPERHLDTACCLYRLIDSGAFRIVPFTNSYDPAFHRRYDVPDCEEVVAENNHEPFVLASEIANDPLLKQIDILQEKYDQMKVHHLPETRPAIKIQEQFGRMVEQHRSEYVDSQMRKRLQVQEDIDMAHQMEGEIDAGHTMTRFGSSKGALKEKAYKSSIQYNKNRRYADPNQREIVDGEATPMTGRGKTPKKITVKKETPATKPRGRTPKSKKAVGKVEAASDHDEVLEEEPATSLSVQEGRTKAAAKKKQQQLEAEAEAAGLLPPLEVVRPLDDDSDPYTPLMLLTDPVAKSATKKKRTAVSLEKEDPEFAKILKSYEATADEKKAMAEMEKLTEDEPTSPKPKRKAVTPRGRKKLKKETE